MLSKPVVSIAIIAALQLSPNAVRAEVSAAELAVAQQHYEHAREQQGKRNWAACEASIRQALEIFETPGLLFHLAFCKEQQHRWVEALVDYRRAGDLVASGAKAVDVAELLPPAIEQLELKTPQLRLNIDNVPRGSRMFVDGKELAPVLIGKSVPLNPGSRAVRVEAPGYLEFSQEVNLVPEERRSLQVNLVPVETGRPISSGSVAKQEGGRPASDPTRGVVLISEALVALSGLGVGVGYTVYGESQRLRRDKNKGAIQDDGACRESREPLCAVVVQADQEMRSARTWATVGYAVAGAAAAGFVVTWLLWPEDTQPSAQLQLQVDSTAAGLSLGGSW